MNEAICFQIISLILQMGKVSLCYTLNWERNMVPMYFLGRFQSTPLV